MSYQSNKDLEIIQAAINLVQEVWPGYKGDLVEALDEIRLLNGRRGRSPGVQQIYDEIRADLESRSK